MVWETKQVLITVKAYPNPSKKYGETVCVAGIELESKKWIRLYPITYRDLEVDKKFKKYDVIEIKTAKALKDKRPESFKVDVDSIKIIAHYDTKGNWQKRKEIISSTASNSLCEIYEECKHNDKSLGMFKPQNVKFLYQQAKPNDRETRETCYAQLSLYNNEKDVLRQFHIFLSIPLIVIISRIVQDTFYQSLIGKYANRIGLGGGNIKMKKFCLKR